MGLMVYCQPVEPDCSCQGARIFPEDSLFMLLLFSDLCLYHSVSPDSCAFVIDLGIYFGGPWKPVSGGGGPGQCLPSNPSQTWSFVQWKANQPQSRLLKEQSHLVNEPMKLRSNRHPHLFKSGNVRQLLGGSADGDTGRRLQTPHMRGHVSCTKLSLSHLFCSISTCMLDKCLLSVFNAAKLQ